MEICVPYGRSQLSAVVPGEYPLDIIEAPSAEPASDPLEAVHRTLDNLLGGLTWDALRGKRTAAVAVSDKTRPVPHQHLLPPLLERLEAIGIPAENVTLYVATGTHPPMTEDELPSILPPEVLRRCRVISHDAEDYARMTYLGDTSRGTPVWCNTGYTQAGLRITLGDIEPHQFAGFSGGVKTAAIGLAALATINPNHALMTHPDSQLGEYETNPARLDIEEIGAKIGIHLALNAILNHERRIVHALAGEPRAVMLHGTALSRLACQVGVTRDYALIVASPGGHPKDINLYQSQKGLAHAVRIARPGGAVILAAACPEGTGSLHYEQWMVGKDSYATILRDFAAEGFRIGPHKAYQIARDASRFRLSFVSRMDPAFARSLLLNPVESLQAALDQALAGLPPGERIAVLPHAATTIPYLIQ